MRLYQAVDKMDGEDSYWLVYPTGEVAVMYVGRVRLECIAINARRFLTSAPERFNDAIDPVLVKEWD